MTAASRPHVLGIDDGPFDKWSGGAAPIVAVTMEGRDLVENVAITRFPVDGGQVTDFLGDWLRGLRPAASLQAVVLGGITIAGLAVVEVHRLAAVLALPVIVTTRKDPRQSELRRALESAGLPERIPLLEAAPAAACVEPGLHLACAGIAREDAVRIVRACRRKALLPEPLRLAHMIGAALVSGESRGRV